PDLTLKRTNTKIFLNQLKHNLKPPLIPLTPYHLKPNTHTIYIQLSPQPHINQIIQPLSKLYPIKSITPLIKIHKNQHKINQSPIHLSHHFQKPSTFNLHLKPVHKSFRLHTYEFQRQVGRPILKE
ncbi:THUMP domain-containing protein, partial [Staphylococcus epidermidis]